MLAWPPLGSLALIAPGQLLDVSLQLDTIGVSKLHPGPELMPRVGSGKQPLAMLMILLFRAGQVLLSPTVMVISQSGLGAAIHSYAL